MAKAKKSPLPPSAETHAEIVRLIRESSQPVLASALAKSLLPPHKIPAAQLEAVLTEYVTAGTLHRIPPSKANGKPRYWDRDLSALLRAGLKEVFHAAEAPLTAKEVASRIAGGTAAGEADVAPLLEERLASGELYLFPPKKTAGKPRYWDRDPIAALRGEVLKFLETKGPQKRAPVRKLASSIDDAKFQSLLDELQLAGQLFSHPPLGKAKEPSFAIRPASPQPYLQEIEKALAQVVDKLHGAHVPEDDLRRAVVQMVESAGIRFGSLPGPRIEPAPVLPAARLDLIELMKQIEPGAERGALVGAGDLRRAAGVSKEEFDQAALALARDGRLSLHRHDFASSLSPERRDELVSDGAGDFFVGMALRPSNE